ncbi:MAG TPA: (deoxy)nucleoside triphosphate pyrophosphohydrolase [Candidatus Latescibacteria bacterium]|nr:(deoxy)nucleoside triphosphate pyrophosphohydrolase [Candidatus Latescibacterota bacterium]HOS64900.1 (deoxy)nucleoside triphosphate pyrophosphohydrolase [Candidatus Latescibacterota bacterium]
MSSRPIEVVAAVIRRGGRVLVTQRNPDSHMGGMWEFPGGKVEPGETHAETLKRELREELGVRTIVGEKITLIRHAYPDRTVRLHFYRAELRDGGEPRPIGCAALRWVTPDELATLPMPPADAPVVGMLQREPKT